MAFGVGNRYDDSSKKCYASKNVLGLQRHYVKENLGTSPSKYIYIYCILYT